MTTEKVGKAHGVSCRMKHFWDTVGPINTDLKGFHHTGNNNSVQYSNQSNTPGKLHIAQPKFDLESYEAFDLCYVHPKNHMKGDLKCKDAKSQIMSVLCARKPGQECSNESSSLHPMYNLSAQDVDRQWTYNQLNQLFTNVCLDIFSKHNCHFAKGESHDGKKTLLRIKIDEDTCKKEADKHNYPLQMDANVTSFEQFKKDPSFVGPYVPYERSIERTARDGSAMDTLGYVWQRYDRLSRPFNYSHKRTEEELSIFTDSDRVRIFDTMMNEFVNVTMMEKHGYLSAHYPLHQPAILKTLHAHWATFLLSYTTSQPLDLIHSYFGEKIALYFAWSESFAKMLIIPAVFGFILWILESVFDSKLTFHPGWLNYVRLAYCALITAWATWFHRMWLRRENCLRLRWGSDIVTGPRTPLLKSPFFKPSLTTSDPVNPNNKSVLSVSKLALCGKKTLAVLMTTGLVLFCLMIVQDEAMNVALRMMGLISKTKPMYTWEHLIRADKVREATEPHSSSFLKGMWYLAYMPLVILTKIIDHFWANKIAPWIAKFENNRYYEQLYRTQSMTTFAMKITLRMVPLIYYAFLREYFADSCRAGDDGRCIIDTRKMLQGWVVAGITGNLWEFGKPILKSMWKRKSNIMQDCKGEYVHPFYEVQSLKDEYKTKHQAKDYNEAMINFVFVACFGTIFPLLPVFAFGVAMVEIRSDAWKLCKVYRRTWPIRAPDGQGCWNDVQRSVTVLSVIINVLICGIVTIGFHRSLVFKLTFSLILLCTTLAFKEFVEYRFPAVSKLYRTMKARAHIVHFEAIWGTKNVDTKGMPIGL